MGLSPATDPDDLVPVRTQVTKAQQDWLVGEKKRRHVRSVAAVIRQIVQAAMDADAEQRKEAQAS